MYVQRPVYLHSILIRLQHVALRCRFPYNKEPVGTESCPFKAAHPWYPTEVGYYPPKKLNSEELQQIFQAAIVENRFKRQQLLTWAFEKLKDVETSAQVVVSITAVLDGECMMESYRFLHV